MKEVPTSREYYHSDYQERLGEQAEGILLNPALDELIIASIQNNRLNEEAVKELEQLKSGSPEYLQAKAALIQKAMDWRTAPDGTTLERHEIPGESDLPEEFRAQIQNTAEQLGMFEAVHMPAENPDIVAVFGATVTPVDKRTKFAFNALEGSNYHPRYIFGLGAEREMTKGPDLGKADAYPYVTEYTDKGGKVVTVETNLMAEAQASWLQNHGYSAKLSRYMRDPFSSEEVVDDANNTLREKTAPSPYGFQLVEFTGDSKPGWAPKAPLVSISPTYDQESQKRANTGDTVRFMFEMLERDPELPENAQVVFVSHGIYRLGQDLEAKRICAELGDCQVTTIGYEQQAPASAKLVGGEIGKVAQKAGELLAFLNEKKT